MFRTYSSFDNECSMYTIIANNRFTRCLSSEYILIYGYFIYHVLSKWQLLRSIEFIFYFFAFIRNTAWPTELLDETFRQSLQKVSREKNKIWKHHCKTVRFFRYTLNLNLYTQGQSYILFTKILLYTVNV